MRIEPDLSGVGIVFLGHFNPAILTPAWFAMHGLLPDKVAESGTLGVAHSDLTEFSAEWLQLRATSNQLQIETAQSPYIQLCDFAVRTFREHLFHTPLKAFGINRLVHFRVRTAAERYHIGRSLAPTTPWGRWGRILDADESQSGMTSVQMTQVDPDDRPAGGQINVTVQPSVHVGKGRTGVFVAVNDHFASDVDGPGSATRIADLLSANFESSISHSDQIIDHVMSLASTEAK